MLNAPDADPQKAYLLFAQYHVIGTSQCTAAESQLERARRSLGYYRSKKYWQDDLRQYLHPDYDALRAFVIDTSQDSWTFQRNAMEYPYSYEWRQSEWEEKLWNQPSVKRDHLPIAETGTYFYFPLEDTKAHDSFSYVFRFSVQTMPPGRFALLLCDMSVRRWVRDLKNPEKPVRSKDKINAHIYSNPT